MRGVDVVGVYNFACSLREVLAKHPFLPHGCGLFSGSYFPSFSEGLSLRVRSRCSGGLLRLDFPSFSEGLSLRAVKDSTVPSGIQYFPSFSEGLSLRAAGEYATKFKIDKFPFLFGGTFIEGMYRTYWGRYIFISLPFRRDFH